MNIDPSNFLTDNLILLALNITFDMLYEPAEKGAETERSLGETGISRAKARIYAEKMGYIGD